MTENDSMLASCKHSMLEIYVFTPICDNYGGIPLILHNEGMFEEESVVAKS